MENKHRLYAEASEGNRPDPLPKVSTPKGRPRFAASGRSLPPIR